MLLECIPPPPVNIAQGHENESDEEVEEDLEEGLVVQDEEE